MIIYIYIIYDILDHFVMFDFIVLGACAVRLSQVGRHVCFSPGVGGFVSDGSTVLYSVKESGEVVIGVDDGPVTWPSERGRPLVLMAVPETFFFLPRLNILGFRPSGHRFADHASGGCICNDTLGVGWWMD